MLESTEEIQGGVTLTASRVFGLLSALLLTSAPVAPYAAETSSSASAPAIQRVADAAPTATLSIRQATELALSRYPQIKVTAAQRQAAASGIKLARQVYLPRIEGVVSASRITSNNVSTWFFPAGAILGENVGVRSESSGATGWTSSVGTYIGWEPFDFGARRAKVEAAESAEEKSKHAIERTKLEVAGNTVDAFLAVLASEGTVVAAKAALERAKVFMSVVNAQVNAQIRPGVDASRARAEHASAEIQLSRAQEALAVARATLSQYTGATELAVATGDLPKLPGKPPTVITDLSLHPAMQEQSAAIAEAKSRLKVASHSADPKFALEGSVFGYDSAFSPDGSRDGGSAGLGFTDNYNYGAGVTMNVPLGELLVIGDRKSQERARLTAEMEKEEQLRVDLSYLLATAEAKLAGARQVAQQTPTLVQAARESYTQAAARYKASLAEVVDVADAQRVLAQAEIDEVIANLQVWQSWFTAAALAPSAKDFIKEIP